MRHAKNGPPDDRNLRFERIYATVDAIPPGRVATYGQVAAEAGLEGRARLVGKLLSSLPAASRLPWHRVMGAGGRIALGPETAAGRRQIRLLRAEGVEFTKSERVNLKRFGWLAPPE